MFKTSESIRVRLRARVRELSESAIVYSIATCITVSAAVAGFGLAVWRIKKNGKDDDRA